MPDPRAYAPSEHATEIIIDMVLNLAGDRQTLGEYVREHSPWVTVEEEDDWTLALETALREWVRSYRAMRA